MENVASDEEPCSLAEVAEDNESGDSETATEVEVSEKTLKFKISTTEGALASGRKSYPGSRKGSREKVQQLNCIEVARAVQGEKDRRRMLGAHSFDQRAMTGKKLSFDTSELIDDHARRHFNKASNRRRISNDEYGFRHADDFESLISIERLKKRNSTHAAIGIRKFCDSRPCEKNENNKQGTVCALTMDGERNLNDNGDQSSSAVCKNEDCEENSKPVINVCKFDNITLDNSPNNKSDSLDHGTDDKAKGENASTDEQLSPNNSNRSLLSRLKQFTDRLGLSIDKDSSKLRGMLSLKNNNGTRMTLPLRYRGGKKDANPPCCKSMDCLEDDKRASTLPKAKSGAGGNKKSWKQRLTLGRDRAANSLDSLPPSSPVKPTMVNTGTAMTAPGASTSHSSSTSNLPARCENYDASGRIGGALEPDQRVLETSIELM